MPLRVLRRHLKRPLRLLKPAALFIRGWCPTDALHQDWYQIRSNLLSLLEPAQRLLEMSSVKPSRHPAVVRQDVEPVTVPWMPIFKRPQCRKMAGLPLVSRPNGRTSRP